MAQIIAIKFTKIKVMQLPGGNLKSGPHAERFDCIFQFSTSESQIYFAKASKRTFYSNVISISETVYHVTAYDSFLHGDIPTCDGTHRVM